MGDWFLAFKGLKPIGGEICACETVIGQPRLLRTPQWPVIMIFTVCFWSPPCCVVPLPLRIPGGVGWEGGPPVVLQDVFGTELSDSYQGRQLSALRLNTIMSCWQSCYLAMRDLFLPGKKSLHLPLGSNPPPHGRQTVIGRVARWEWGQVKGRRTESEDISSDMGLGTAGL